MNRFKIVNVLLALIIAVIVAFMVGAQTDQKLELGLEKEFPSVDDSPRSVPAHPDIESWIKLSEDAALKVVEYRDGYVITQLMVHVKDEWIPAEVQGPGTGHEFATQ